MAIKEENINRFIYAMFNFMSFMKKGVEDCCAQCGHLSEKEFILINYVGQKQHAKMSDVASNMSVPLSTLTSIVDKLVESKYLTRYHSNEDRRVVFITLGSSGKDTYKTFMTQKQEIARNVLSNFKVQEQEDLIKYLEKIPAIMEENKNK